MKAIIVAAGMGRRLSPYTDDRPKCLVEIGGRPLLARQLEAYRAAGVQRFIIVRGYLGERLTAALQDEPGIEFVDNPDFRRNNILLSLMCAEEHLAGGFFFSYADIVFRPQLVAAVRDAEGELALCIDPHYAAVYQGRTDHPIEEAELAAVRDGRVVAVGKRAVPVEQAHGEFIGLMRVSAAGAERMRQTYRQRRQELGLSAPYGRAPRLEVAYLTDLLTDLIAQGADLRAVDTPGPGSWREIDTVQDLERARAVLDW
ncbi:MAG: phosphocholine cytidylyltransferase family protein [Myxococcales bacterium]|nr:phosphocholine cytidylyltransferase family protein [Myxococcota bacterium]MDW8280712.1 phosphocholine cytidylyltransferase family protein [Myxococcales bacterium]